MKHETLEFRQCARGYVISTGDRYSGMIGTIYAFDRVEDAAAWIVEQYAAQAIEARRAETPKSDSVEDESAAPKGCAQ